MNKEQKEKVEEIKEENLEDTKEELNLKQKYEELDDRYKRICAEFENYKKRTEKERFETYTRARVDIVEKLLPVLDSFDKAEESMPKEYKEGMDLILRQIEDFLKEIGVEKIEAVDMPFDPELHDAVKMTDNSGKESNTVVTDLRTGYRLGNNIIRHTMVEVQQ